MVMFKDKDCLFVDDLLGFILMDVWSCVRKFVCECGGISLIMVDYF